MCSHTCADWVFTSSLRSSPAQRWCHSSRWLWLAGLQSSMHWSLREGKQAGRWTETLPSPWMNSRRRSSVKLCNNMLLRPCWGTSFLPPLPLCNCFISPPRTAWLQHGHRCPCDICVCVCVCVRDQWSFCSEQSSWKLSLRFLHCAAFLLVFCLDVMKRFALITVDFLVCVCCVCGDIAAAKSFKMLRLGLWPCQYSVYLVPVNLRHNADQFLRKGGESLRLSVAKRGRGHFFTSFSLPSVRSWSWPPTCLR